MPKKKDPVTLVEPLWEIQPSESSTWYRRFCGYRNQIGKRNLTAVYREERQQIAIAAQENPESGRACQRVASSTRRPKNIPGSWEDARLKWRWEERAAAWDKHLQNVDDQLWEERFKQYRENAWQNYELLTKKAEMMIRMPIEKQVVTSAHESGVRIITIEATDWHEFIPALQMFKLSDQLGKAAIGDINAAIALIERAGMEVRVPGSDATKQDEAPVENPEHLLLLARLTEGGLEDGGEVEPAVEIEFTEILALVDTSEPQVEESGQVDEADSIA
jgi:hypothetical protein